MLKSLARKGCADRLGCWMAVACAVLLFANSASAQLTTEQLLKRAKDRRGRNDHMGAILDLTAVIEKDPKNAEAYIERALAKDALTLPVFAIGDLDRAIEINPNLPIAYENRERIRYANSIGNWSLIPKDIEKSIKAGGNNPLTIRHRATFRSMTGDLDGALADFDRYLKADPKDRFYGYSFRGQTRLRYGDAAAAIEDLTRDINNPPPLDNTWLHRGLAYLVLGDQAKAERDFASYLNKVKTGQATVNEYKEIGKILSENSSPASAADFVKRAELLFAKNWKSNAVADCTRALAFDENYVPAWVLKGRSLRDLQCYEEAMEAFGKAAKLEPTNPEHLYQRAWCAWNIEKYDQAIADCDAVLAVDNRHLNGLNIKAICLYSQDKFDDAIQLHLQCSEITPTDAVIWANLADDYLRTGEYDKCLAACNKSLELTPNSTRVFELKAKAYWGSGEYKAADGEFARWIEAAPRDSSAYLSRAKFKLFTKQFDAALADLQKARDIDKLHAEIPRITTLMKAAQGDINGALQEIARTLMLNSGHYINFATRGAILLKAGKTEAAEQDFETAGRINPLFKTQLPKLREAILARGATIALLELPKPKGDKPSVSSDTGSSVSSGSTGVPTPVPGPTPPVATVKQAEVPPAVKKILDDGLKAYEAGEYEKAGTLFKRVITLFPRNADSYMYRGLVNQRAGKTEDAERDFANAIRLNPALQAKINDEKAKIK